MNILRTIVQLLLRHRKYITILVPIAKKLILGERDKDIPGVEKKDAVMTRLEEFADNVFGKVPSEILGLVFSIAYRILKDHNQV